MCLAVPGKVIEVRGESARVDFQGNELEINTVMTPNVVGRPVAKPTSAIPRAA